MLPGATASRGGLLIAVPELACDLWRHRDLLWLLTVREIRIRYARAALGVAWAGLLPAATMLIFAGLDFSRLVPPASAWAAVPYPLFAYCGLLAWGHFATSLTQATPSLVALRDLLRKSSFAREVIPLSRIVAAVLDLGVGAVLFGALLATYGHGVHLPAIAVPVILAAQLAFTAGLALLLAAANVYFRDVGYLLQMSIVLLMFASPVVYPLPDGGAMAAVLAWNPLASFLDAYRACVLLGRWPWRELAPGAAAAVLSLAIGAAVFRRLSPRLPEEA